MKARLKRLKATATKTTPQRLDLSEYSDWLTADELRQATGIPVVPRGELTDADLDTATALLGKVVRRIELQERGQSLRCCPDLASVAYLSDAELEYLTVVFTRAEGRGLKRLDPIEGKGVKLVLERGERRRKGAVRVEPASAVETVNEG